jgi:hypothetical protein
MIEIDCKKWRNKNSKENLKIVFTQHQNQLVRTTSNWLLSSLISFINKLGILFIYLSTVTARRLRIDATADRTLRKKSNRKINLQTFILKSLKHQKANF